MSAYQEGRLADALVDVYLHIDRKLASEAARSELEVLAGVRDQRGSGRYVDITQSTTLHGCSSRAQVCAGSLWISCLLVDPSGTSWPGGRGSCCLCSVAGLDPVCHD